MYNVAKYEYGLGQKKLYWRLLTFSGIVNIFLNTLMHTQRKKTNKQINKNCLKTNSCLQSSPPTQPENVIYQKEFTMLHWLRKYTENFTASPK